MASRNGVGARSFGPGALRNAGAAGAAAVALWLAPAPACTPDVPVDPVPEEMTFDLQSLPPKAPQPTVLVVNPATRHIDFSLARITVATDCTTSMNLSPAECEFDQYLQRLDGFPTVTPAAAPTSAPLDQATVAVPGNVVVMNATTGLPVTDAKVAFDAASGQLIVKPARHWAVGSTYWIGVRGYGNGVRAVGGKEVVGSATHALLKQPMSLTCGAVPPGPIMPGCPGLTLFSQSYPTEVATALLFQLEPVHQIYQASGGIELMAAAGLPREELAVLWGFPIHSSSVAELDPTAGLVPVVTGGNQIHIGVQGTVDPATVTAVAVMKNPGTVLLMDLTEAAAGNLNLGFPPAEAHYAMGEVVVTAAAPLVAGHQYGVFMTNGVKDLAGAPLVPSPISVLLTLRGTLVSATGHSTISTVADADAVQLEAGRQQLGTLFENMLFQPLTGVGRENLVYGFAFEAGGAP